MSTAIVSAVVWLVHRHHIPDGVTRKTVAKLGWKAPLTSAKARASDLQYNKGPMDTAESKTTTHTGKSKAVASALS